MAMTVNQGYEADFEFERYPAIDILAFSRNQNM